jgi:hypothetical protein
MMCARSVTRSSSALHSRGFGNTCIHSENGRFSLQNHGRLLRPLGDHLEQQFGSHFGQRHISDFGHGDQLVSQPPPHGPAQLPLLPRLHHLVHQPSRRREPYPPPLPAGGHAQRRRQMGLPGARRARNIMPMAPRSSRFSTPFTRRTARTFASNGGQSFQRASTFSASCATAPSAGSLRGSPTRRRAPTSPSVLL